MDAEYHQTLTRACTGFEAKNSGGWSRTNTHPASAGCSTLELHRILIQRRRQESNLLGTGLQPVAWPSSPGVGRASGESRTHTGRITGAVRCQLRHAGYHYLRQESNLVLDFRRVACFRHTPKTKSRNQESGIRSQKPGRRHRARTSAF